MSQFTEREDIRALWKDACTMTQIEYPKKGTDQYNVVRERYDWLKLQADFAKASEKGRKWLVACHRLGLKYAKKGSEDYQRVLEVFKTIKDSDITKPPY